MKMINPAEAPITHSQDIKLQQWVFRILLELDAHKQFISPHGFSNHHLADYLQLHHFDDQLFTQQTQQAVISELRQRHAELEPFNPPLHRSAAEQAIEQLATRIGLNAVETAILEFTLQLHLERLLDDVTEWLGPLTSSKVYRALAIILRVSEAEIRYALGPASMLTRTGLVNLELNGAHPLRIKLEPFSLTLAERLYSGETDAARLLQGMVSRCSTAHLTFGHYVHVPAVNVLRQLLHHALQSARVGVNILIYGPPGTGKSQLCRLVADELQSTLYEVTSENEMSRLLSRSRRRRASRGGQRFFCGEQARLLCDAADDLFIHTPRIACQLPHPVPTASTNPRREVTVITPL